MEVRARLLIELSACIAEWTRLLGMSKGQEDGEAGHVSAASVELSARARSVGFGGIAFHLTELLRHFHAAGDRAAARESLEVVLHLTEQARHELSAAELQAMARLSSLPPPERPAQREASTDLAPPPMITIGTARSALAGGPSLGRASSPQSPRPPPRIDSDVSKSSDAPPAPFGSAAPPSASPAWESVPVAPAPLSVRPEAMRPQQGVPPAATPASPVPGAPNLFVRSMLGLRAFGKRPETVQAVPAAERKASQHPPLLNLKRDSAPPKKDPDPLGDQRPPLLLDRLPSGLPPLAPSPAGSDRPASRASSSKFREREQQTGGMSALLGDIRRGRASRPPAKGSRLSQRPGEAGWKAGLLLGFGVLVVLGGMVWTIVAVSRQRNQALGVEPSTPTASSSGSASPAGVSSELPQLRLSTENERLRTVLAQVHGRGKESPELRALVDEHAARTARALKEQKCQDLPVICAEAAKIREAAQSRAAARRVIKKRGTSSPDRLRSAWIAGLKLPEIPIEDDPRVKRWFEYYTEGQVGRELFQGMLFRCGAYRDRIHSTLISYDLPTDLLAVVFAESGCEPQATSPKGAAGLWQFLPETGRAYHLRVIEGTVDERRSAPKSTEAAVKFLRDLYAKLGAWNLTFAAYNMGPFGLASTLERAGGADVGFWDLIDAEMLNDETSDYVPRIEAIALILNNLQRFRFAGSQMRAPQLTSDLEVLPGTRLSIVARAAATSVTYLRTLNLDITGETTPSIPNFAIQVPKDVVWQARDSLKDLLSNRDDKDLCVPPTFDWGRQRFTEEMATACRRRLPAVNATADPAPAPADAGVDPG